MQNVTLLVARYNEDLYWLLKLPDDIRVVVYNKGGEIRERKILARIDQLFSRKNVGRESESYLAFLRQSPRGASKWTAFAQGDPFPHSPDFLKLMDRHRQWRNIQPLTVQYLREANIPPYELMASDTLECLGDARVRSEVFSLNTVLPVAFEDPGMMTVAREYRAGHHLAPAENLVQHFLEVAGWDDLARKASRASFGRFAYGAMFAVRSDLLSNIPDDVLDRLIVMARGHRVYGYMFEKLWLHMFGLPFIRLNEPAIPAILPNIPPARKTGKSSAKNRTDAHQPPNGSSATSLNIFTTITPEYEESCGEWLVSSVNTVEPAARLKVECFHSITGSSNFQSETFNLHNRAKCRKLIQWIDQHRGDVVFITDSDIVYLKPFVNELLEELGESDMALAREFPHSGYNIGQMIVRCSEAVVLFFRDVLQELERGAWDQEAINRLLESSALRAKPLSLRFANTVIWRSLTREEKSNVLSYHATSSRPADGKSSMQLKQEYISEVVAEWKEITKSSALDPDHGSVVSRKHAHRD